MGIPTGGRLGPYVIQGTLGAGGMGVVYRARDVRLGRDVAIKVLPEGFASDPERLGRLEREARVLASLNHPHIGAIYGLEETGETRGLVLELVEGHTLAERLAAGSMPIREALAIARQIVDALDAAHEKGIIHRDLKPANIKITPEGTVKVLDFGLAKAAAVELSQSDPSHSPTLTLSETCPGTIMGTVAYMSPEQARGKPLDKRTDIWAFGCVLYELVAGRRTFTGETTSDLLAAILGSEPDWATVPSTTPPAVRRLLARCLDKDPKRRLRDIADARADLDDAVGTATLIPSARREPRQTSRLALYASAVTIAVLIATVIALPRHSQQAADPPRVVRTAITLPSEQRISVEPGGHPLATSPDGTRVVYAAEEGAEARLYLRHLDEFDAKVVPGTSGASHPFFSPDGNWIGFFAEGTLQKVAVAGGAPSRICDVPQGNWGGSWGSDGTIVFASHQGELFKVSSAGGTVTPIMSTNDRRSYHWPDILPDNKSVLAAVDNSALAVISLETGTRRVVGRVASQHPGEGPAVLGRGSILQPRYVPTGHLLYGQASGVWAVPFDVASLTLTGSPVSVVEAVYEAPASGAIFFALSRSGVLVYVPGSAKYQLVFVDREGRSTPISSDREAFRHPDLSPDGRRIAVTIDADPNPSDIWIFDADRGTKTRFTVAGHNLTPVWSPRGTHLAYYNSRDGQSRIVSRPADGSGAEEVLADKGAFPTSWSPDGLTLLAQAGRARSMDIWIISRSQPGDPRPLLATAFTEWWARFSPDGRSIAYESDETGQPEVYVSSYPDLQRKTPVSTEGGRAPAWSSNGRELFYWQGDALMAAPVEHKTAGLQIGTPRQLFSGHYAGAGGFLDFDVGADGRFLMIKPDASASGRLNVVQNWFEELKGLAAVSR